MKRILVLTIICLCAALVFAGEEGSWFDMENCSFCKPLMEEAGMLEKLGWDHYNISGGKMTVSTIPEEYAEKFQAARDKMNAVEEKLKAGEAVDMCNMCTAMGAFYQGGAKDEKIATKTGFVCMTTSDDPEVVSLIHAWVDRTNSEMTKMEAMMKEGDAGHEGHDH